MIVIKREKQEEVFDFEKIKRAVTLAFESVNETVPDSFIRYLFDRFTIEEKTMTVEEIQDEIELALMKNGFYNVAKSFILYRDKHKDLRFIKERAEYIERYSSENENAATLSETDANANVQNKNVATLEPEIYKSLNVDLSRYRIVKKLKQLYGDSAPDYVKDLGSGVIYKHDESSAPAIKPYCVAVNLYPFLVKGTSTLDKSTTTAPSHLSSFCGQFGNLAFLLSSQFQGAVAFAELFNVITYYCIKDWGSDFYLKENEVTTSPIWTTQLTVKDSIHQAFQAIVHTINQPAGNRSYQSPFTNVSYFDKYYWEAMFGEFVFPDGSKVSYEQVNYIQQLFMKWLNKERLKTLLTFPVETVAMLHDGKDILDKDWKNFVAEMYAEGHSFFTYLSDSADSLSSCCRLRNSIKPEFSFTSGNVGVATGSKSVITINLNRLIQNWANKMVHPEDLPELWCNSPKEYKSSLERILKEEIRDVLERIYKYHTAYNELLKDLEKNNMFPVYSEGYISLSQQFLTIGINGCNEAAMFLGIDISDNDTYRDFCNLITSTISKANAEHSDKELRFNTEFVPAESLGIKNYKRDKADGYWVPEDRNCYTSYFFMPDDPKMSVLEQFRLHGRGYTDTLDGGVALHCNLEDHLSKEQYLKLIDYAVQEGTSYFTFNIPNSQCDDCGYITKHQIKKCPKCGSEKITWWTRIIGYLRPIKGFSKGRREEANKRIYHGKC